MLIAGRWLIAATLLTAMPTWPNDAVDDRWAEKVLGDSEFDQGWSQRCQDDWNDGRETYCEVRELPYRATGRPIAIDGGENGGMTVMGWERDHVRVLYRVKARGTTTEQAKTLAQKVRVEDVRGRLTPQGPASTRQEWWSVEMKVWVPRASSLSLRTVNGPVAVRGVRGTMEIHAQNGPVSLVELAGAVYARVQNGPLHVSLDGQRWSGAGLDAEAQNGPVNLLLPKKYSARLETGTVNGPAIITYPLGIEGRIRGHFTKTLGSGGPPVRVVTENGPFRFAER
jgi:hypothetical protein